MVTIRVNEALISNLEKISHIASQNINLPELNLV